MTPMAWASRLNRPGAMAKTATNTPTPSHTTAYFSRSWRRRDSSTMTVRVASALTRAMTWTPLMTVPPGSRVGPTGDERWPGPASGSHGPGTRRPERRLAGRTAMSRPHGYRDLGYDSPGLGGDAQATRPCRPGSPPGRSGRTALSAARLWARKPDVTSVRRTWVIRERYRPACAWPTDGLAARRTRRSRRSGRR